HFLRDRLFDRLAVRQLSLAHDALRGRPMASGPTRGSPDRGAESSGRARISAMATNEDGAAPAKKELGLPEAMAYARELEQDNRLEAADELYRRILALAPDYPDASNFRGVVAFRLGRPAEALDRMAEALTAYRQAVLLRPFHFDSYRRLGSALYGWGRIDEAAEVYRKWLSLEPDNPVAAHLLAACTGREVPARASDACVRT